MKSHDQNISFLIVFLKHFSHVTNFVFVIAFLILISNVNAQKETLSSSPSKSDGFSFDPKLRVNPSVAIIFVCLISAFFIMGCVSVSIRHCFEHRLDAFPDEHTTGSRHRSGGALARGLDYAIIDTFPMFLYSDVKGLKLGKGDLECAVCLNEFEDGETLRLLPKCSHVFHPECIDAWLVSHINCPVCRANLNEPEQETHELATELSNSGSAQEFNNSTSQTDNVVIDIGISSPELINQSQTITSNRPKRHRVGGKFSPSHSSGHSVVQPGEDCERFTLRLPEDVKNRLIKSELSRAKSCVVFTRMRSSTKGFMRTNSGGGRRANSMDYERFNQSNRSGELSFISNSSFLSRDGLTDVGGVDGKEPTNPKNLLSSARSNFKAPFERFFGGAEKASDGERSFTKLRPDKNPI